MGTVNKGEIIRQVAEKTSAPQARTKEMLDAFLDAVTSHAEAGDTVNLIGFGRFSVKARAARTGRNPGTGLPIEIAESRTLTFKASKNKTT